MSPLEVIKYIVEKLDGTSYEPFVNGLLFLLLLALIFSVIKVLLGKNVRVFILKIISKTTKSFKNRRGYAPSVEKFRLRMEPYLDLVSSLFFAFIGLYSFVLVGLTFIVFIHEASWWVLCISFIWILASLIYMRINLESASWAFQTIKDRKG